jgi:hypothetical protein
MIFCAPLYLTLEQVAYEPANNLSFLLGPLLYGLLQGTRYAERDSHASALFLR